MPHISFDYSANLEDLTDLGAFAEALRVAALETGIFPEAGLRVRGFRADHCAIADGHPENTFIDISIRLRGGRAQAAKEAATAHVFAAAQRHLAPVLARHPVALSLEMRDIDPALSPKLNTIRDHMKERG
jgi:5-carboxymethyl-2-hydroxymuconate isomerase